MPTRQSTHVFSCLPFSFVQRQSMSLQPFRSLMVAAQADLHCDNIFVSTRRSHDFGVGLTNLGWDDVWVNDLGPGDQGGVNRIEGRTFFELGGRDCSPRSIRDDPSKTYPDSDIPETARVIEAKRKARMMDGFCGERRKGLDGVRKERPVIRTPFQKLALYMRIWVPFTGGVGEVPSLPVTVSNLIRQRNVK